MRQAVDGGDRNDLADRNQGYVPGLEQEPTDIARIQ